MPLPEPAQTFPGPAWPQPPQTNPCPLRVLLIGAMRPLPAPLTTLTRPARTPSPLYDQTLPLNPSPPEPSSSSTSRSLSTPCGLSCGAFLWTRWLHGPG